MQCTCNVTLGHVIVTIVAVEMHYLLHILSVYLALGIQHVMCFLLIVISGLSGCTAIFHIAIKRQDIRKKKFLEYKLCVLILSKKCL
jgi:hypothetical protein